ncbi:N-6 DNA methylase [Acetobacterium malicum]|uniref:site-specific DNA-methyltransferase (adenine-specific) n=1 Tax=Acetobacterium malicum TaxID=52692 RepID=A0ABR6Z0N6_9FIRM|nr:N-6 DNA methylase [Acetobacterium malicum]MBC3900929.1 N-6 DNA methylase [Acetobacterium malicum]
MDLTGINNYNEYYTNHYFASIFQENAEETISKWRLRAKEAEELRTPWSRLRENSKQYYTSHEKSLRLRSEDQAYPLIKEMADNYLESLGFPTAQPFTVDMAEDDQVPVYLEITKANGAPLLWVMLAHVPDRDANIMQGVCFKADETAENGDDYSTTDLENEELVTKILFSMTEPPRWIILIGLNQIALIDRNKWNEKRYLHFDLEEIFSRREDSTLQAMTVLLHQESLCPEEGSSLLDKLDENSHRHAAGVSQDLKYALRESIELLGNEVLYDMAHRLSRDFENDPVDAAQLTIECLRYMYRMLFMLFIEARPELGYAPMKSQAYVQGYSLESLRDIADSIREDTNAVGDGFYLNETLSKLFGLIYTGYPDKEDDLKQLGQMGSVHDVFVMEPLKAHIFDPDYTALINQAKLRNRVLLKIIDLMSITRSTGRRNDRRGRISYAALGINQMGAVYEALLSYRGFIAEETLFEVKRAGDQFNELDVGYFVPEHELVNYSEDERVRYGAGENEGKLRKYEKGTFIYRLAGREREKSASYYTPEVLTKCLVKYALKELLEEKTADEILNLTICEPAMGSAAFLNEAINQLAEAYLDKKQKERGETISYENRTQELQRVKMYIADRNVYGIDLNPIAVELAEVSLLLNTIYKGAYVPWFGTQLVNGNSLIGARRQCYRVEQLQASQMPNVWHGNAPERIMPGKKRMPKKQVYHFLMGDPGMANYKDKVIKSLAPDEIKTIKDWNRSFTKAHDEDEIEILLKLSSIIDDLWAKQVELQKKLDEKTADPLSVYGHNEDMEASRTSIREKDEIFKRLYKTEEMENAGPYARLKFAMDYWCALWFWPIDEAELLPNRSDFIFEMSLILDGGIVSVTQNQTIGNMQLSLFPSEKEIKANEMFDLFKDLNRVDLDDLCQKLPRLQLVKEIADANKFLHWELEFADLFEERGGFDLVIGNPPWIKMGWNEQAVLSDKQPLFAVKKYTANQITKKREEALSSLEIRGLYFSEYEVMSAMQNFLSNTQNYSALLGMKTNLYKCFLPQAWLFGNECSISAFIHPDGVYDDPNGGVLREELYPRLRRHFQFINERKLFDEVHHNTMFSLNVYSNTNSKYFDTIANLFEVATIEQCYDQSIKGPVPGIKDDKNEWNKQGHPDRVVRVSKNELQLFANLFDGTEEWKKARLPAIHAKQIVAVLACFFKYNEKIGNMKDNFYSTVMWDETKAQSDGIILRNIHFPELALDTIYSGPHIGVSNPLVKTSRSICRLNSDYDSVDLTAITNDYIQRCNYSISSTVVEYEKNTQETPWGSKYYCEYKLLARTMLNISGERTLIAAIVPQYTSHINGLFGMAFADNETLVSVAGYFSSIPYDFYVKITGMSNLRQTTVVVMPNIKFDIQIALRSMLLNMLTMNYSYLWKECWNDSFNIAKWSKADLRLKDQSFESLTHEWTWDTPLRTDYERRQALVEIDVLTAMALGMTLEQLKTIYRIQFPVLQSYEADTWYDRNGRIVFTNNRSLTNVGFTRSEWNEIKDAESGTFTRTITDDTMPGGPVERTIEYVAPFDRCDREADYETAWAFFEEKFKNQ